jgi:hypothetical protein
MMAGILMCCVTDNQVKVDEMDMNKRWEMHAYCIVGKPEDNRPLDQFKEDEMGRACSKNEEEKCI